MNTIKLKSPLKNFTIYGSRGVIVIFGYNEITGLYSVLEISRPAITTDGAIKMRQLPQELTLTQVSARKKHMQSSYKDMDLLYENIPCIYGCIKLLESYYLILITKKSKVASIVGHSIYTIEETAILPITYGMKNSADETRYRTLLSTFEFTKYLYFSYTYDLTKSWQLQATTSSQMTVSSTPSGRVPCQHMFVWNSFAMKPFLRGSHEIPHSSSPLDHWCIPVIYGYVNQRNIQLHPNLTLKFLLIARRSRLFAGTRYLRRGVDILGNVANEVETEQIFYVKSSQPGYIPRITSLVQCRGSIPLFWSHTNLYSPKPDVQLESDLTMRQMAAKKHFENLFIRYGFNLKVLSLVKQIDSKGEIMLGAAYKETCEMLEQLFVGMKKSHKKSYQQQQGFGLGQGDFETDQGIDDISPITFIAYDFLTMAKYQHIAESEGNGLGGPNVFRDLNKICEKIYSSIGFYVDPPIQSIQPTSNWCLKFPITIPSSNPVDSNSFSDLDLLNDILEIDSENTNYVFSDDMFSQFLSSRSTPSDTGMSMGTGSPFGLQQNGILRTNCMDCLDRTNVAQFCYAKLNIHKQLKSIGLTFLSSGLQEIISICMEVWAEHGDAIAIQYGGSGAMHKVDKQEISSPNSNFPSDASPTNPSSSTGDQEFCLTGGSKNALVAVQRYYSNIATDYDRQQSIDLLLGIFEPKKNTTPIWEEKLRTQHLRHGTKGRRQSDITAATQHDLNLLIELDKHVSKQEKIRNDLILLQTNQLSDAAGNGKIVEGNGFVLLEDDDEDDDDEEDDEDEGEDEIWDDEESSNLHRNSVKIPLPGYNIADIARNPFYHVGSLAADDLTEFRDIVEDSEIETINLEEVVAFSYPPVLPNETSWTLYQEKKKPSSSKGRSTTDVITKNCIQYSSQQEQLYADYINLSYSFVPSYVVCHSPSISHQHSFESNQNNNKPKKTDETDSIASLKQQLVREYFNGQNQKPILIPQILSNEQRSESTSSEPETPLERQTLPKLDFIPLPPPATPPPTPATSTSTVRSGIWPFRKTTKTNPPSSVPVVPPETVRNSPIDSFPPASTNTTVTKQRAESTDSTILQVKRSESIATIPKKPSKLQESLLNRYLDNVILEKLQNTRTMNSNGDSDSIIQGVVEPSECDFV